MEIRYRGLTAIIFATLVVMLGLLSGCSANNEELGYVDDSSEEISREHLYDYLFGMFDDDELYKSVHRELHLQGQSLVRDCMASHGFEYVPFIRSVPSIAESLSDEERVELYGFGYATELVPIDDDLEYDPKYPQEEDEPIDPNDAIIDSLSEAEKDAYFEARYGDDPNLDVGGCDRLRFEASIPRLAVFDAFYSGFEDATQRAQADPRMHQLLHDWVECMHDAGFPFSDRDEMLDDLAQKVEPFEDLLDEQWEELERLVEDAPNGDLSALPAEVQLALETDTTIPPEHQNALDALIDYEFALAKADLSCSYFEEEEELYDEYTQQYVDDNALAILEYLNR